MDKSNTVKDGDDSQKKLLHFSPSSLEGWLTKLSTQVRKTRVRYANNAKHHNFIPFIFQQTFPGNRHAGATTVNYTILWFLKHRRPDPQTCVISQVSQAWESIKKKKRKEKVADEIDLEVDTRQPRIVGVDAVPQCGNCVPLQLRGRHVVSGRGSKWAWQWRATPRQRPSLSTH